MKHNCLSVLSVIIYFLFFFFPHTVFSDLTDGFLDNEINFEEMYSDLPLNFNLEKATVSELASLPYFTLESARSVVSFRDSLRVGDSL